MLENKADIEDSTQVLVVVDMQNDFIEGALGTKEAKEIVVQVAKQIQNFKGQVIFTRDTHQECYLETLEGKKLPVKHCIQGTKGWELCDTIQALQTPEMKVFDKNSFGCVALCEYLKTITALECVTLVGVCTDICVISNAMLMKSYLPQVEVKIIANACAGVTPMSHKNALEAMKVCQIQIEE